MPQPKYEPIYREIKNEILSGNYAFGDFLPSENAFAERFKCTRNTVRRALSILTSEGYLMPQHGKGVRVIYKPAENQSLFSVGGIESFSEAAYRNQMKTSTHVYEFREITADEAVTRLTGFDTGSELYYIERVRSFNGKAVILDINYFLKSETPGLTREIAGKSIYGYLENDLGMTITTSRRRVTAKKAGHRDKKYLDLGDKDFVLTVEGQVFNSKGIMFEYTQSRHVPDQVCFIESAVRQKL